MKKTLSLKAFIFRTSFVFSCLGFVIIYYAASQSYSNAVRNNAIGVSSQLASNTFNSMYQVMRMGWTRTQLDDFLQKLRSSNENAPYNIEIYRAPVVEELYGKTEQPPLDDFIAQTLNGKSGNYSQSGDQIRYSSPLLAKAECLGCHHNAREGDVLGIIEVGQSLGPLLKAAQKDLLLNLLYLAPFPFLLSLVVIYFMNRRINQSINNLENNLERVNRVDDLTKLELQSSNLGFSEMDRIYGKFENMTRRMKDVAVDKELLAFEIRLLEKLVISSEVVRDWHEYVNILLDDINAVMTSYNLFSIFKVEEDAFSAEIFWLHPPIEDTRLLMEKVLRRELDACGIFSGVASLEVHHNIANRAAQPISLEIGQITIHTKSLFQGSPKIGGIVGIGMQTEIAMDDPKQLVMESVLSTLMNVVGSVKAIYQYTQDLEYYATRDPLTDLHNQRIFYEMLGYELLRAHRHNYKSSLLVIDLDNFKSINDSFGHGVGDKFLQQFSLVLRDAIRSGDLLARYGGDEFTVILPESDIEQAKMVCDRIFAGLHKLEMHTPSGDTPDLGISIGVAVYPDHAASAKDLFMFADNMMYKAKSQGKGRLYIPTNDDVIEVFRDISEKTLMISKAIKDKRIVPYFQPLMATESGEYEAMEVLSRMELDDGRIMGAHEFIEIAESMGVIHQLDFTVMEKALTQVNREGFKGLIFINMSPRSLVMSEFIPQVKRIASEANIAPERIVFEITERDTVKNMAVLEKFVGNLKDSGFNLAIDDFGSGFSSFHYLKHFPIDFVKIEGEFIANMVNDAKDNAVVRCIAGLAHELKARTIAEYVENQEVLDAVKSINITYAQGFYIRKPTPYIFEPPQVTEQG